MTKTIPKKKTLKKAELLSEEALQIAKERREAKSKGERKRYTQLNAEFQRIASSYKKAFNEQCKEIEENNRMGKNFSFYRSFLENWRYQGNISCKDGHDKGQK